MTDLPEVEADAAQMRQIIMNLILNASEAIGDRSGVIAVTTGVMHCDLPVSHYYQGAGIQALTGILTSRRGLKSFASEAQRLGDCQTFPVFMR